MIMKRLLSILFLCVLTSTLMAQEKRVNLLHSSNPGGIIDATNRALQENLERQGYSVEVVRTTSCRAASNWIKNNPGKPVVMAVQTEEMAYYRMSPTADDACDLELTKERLLAISYQNYYIACSMLPPDQALKKFQAGNHRVGVTYYAATNHVVAQQWLKDLNIPSSRVVRFQDNPKLVQALVSGDVDFTFQTNALATIKAGGQCFLTSSNVKDSGHTPLSALDPKNRWINGGHMYVYVGINIDKPAMTKVAVDTVKTHQLIADLVKTNGYSPGLAAGETEQQQWDRVHLHLSRYFK
jgi:hypothetical protein